VTTYELWNIANPGAVRRGVKTGFCFFDTTPYRLGLPGAPQASYYKATWCGTRNSLTNRVGVSVGWGDRYPYNFSRQWIDVTGVPAGDYMVRATVDQQNYYLESDQLDNCVWARVRIPASGTALSVLATGNDCGPSSVTAVDDFPGGVTWNPARRVVFEPGTYVGYKFNSAGTTLGTKSFRLGSVSGASVTRRDIPTGYPSNWFYVVNGVWAGYWIKDTAAIDMV
jgi:hypothetical protein